MTRLVLIGVIVSSVLIFLVLGLIRSRKLQERQALLWLFGCVAVVVLGVSSGALAAFSDLLGIAYPPSALFLLVVAFLGLALLDAVITISKLSVRTRTLAQRLALMDERIEQMARQLGSSDNTTDATDGA
jgi:hypothetical protein